LLFSLLPRVQQYQAWLGNPSDHWVGEISVVSADSYYWLRIAREIRDGETTFDGKDPHQDYPDGRERTRVPAFSWLIAAFSPIFEGDVYRTGIWLSIVLSSLFIIPLGLYGFSITYPIAGLLGGAVGTFSSIYMLRTSVSNIDTEGGEPLLRLVAGVDDRIGAPRGAVAAQPRVLGSSRAVPCRFLSMV
jgi:dolichyl-diphosphooligosaccharide--protein glycosyltransferase